MGRSWLTVVVSLLGRPGKMTCVTDALVPSGYGQVLDRLKAEVRAAQVQAHRVANAELLRLYRRIGQTIIEQQSEAGWGARVIDRLAADLRTEFPTMSGLSRSNLYYMRAFAAAWPEDEVVPRGVGQLPWRMVRCLLDKLDDRSARDWYAAKAAENGWALSVLEHQITTDLRSRAASAPSNFPDRLPPVDSDLAREAVKDPYVFDFLTLREGAAERDLEQAMMDRLQETLLEMGSGFAFVGRQMRFDIDGDEFVVDLLLFHVTQLRYTVIELKMGKFKAEYAGQLGFYIAMIDDELRRPEIHAPTVGILLCADRNERVVRYALRAAAAPMAVATYTYDKLPAAEKDALPNLSVLTDALETTPAAPNRKR